MTSSEIALAAFGLCSSVRVVAYLLQIVTIARDTEGASGVSCTAWSLFALSHISTVAYALITLGDWGMAMIFGANATCCSAVIVLTVLRRRTRVAGRLRHEVAEK